MKSSAVKYGARFGCKFGQAHDFVRMKTTAKADYERCTGCNARRRYNHAYKNRVNNVEYLRDHVRKYAQRGGSTNRVYQKIHHPENCIINI